MRKRTLKTLNLNRKSVSNLNLTGGSSPAPPRSDAKTGCMSCARPCDNYRTTVAN
ncbi:hypothetical protein [Kordia sp.]|uniref:hypothetical protein n=1 Tax=Kordia sp. TaxID=1965332 RepID=UPI003D6B9DC7